MSIPRPAEGLGGEGERKKGEERLKKHFVFHFQSLEGRESIIQRQGEKKIEGGEEERYPNLSNSNENKERREGREIEDSHHPIPGGGGGENAPPPHIF